MWLYGFLLSESEVVQKTKKRIAFDVLTLGLRATVLCIEILLKLNCNFISNNIYKLQVICNILKLSILPATVLGLFDSIEILLRNSKNPKQDMEKVEVIAKQLAIIGLSLYILISVNSRAKFFFEEVFIRSKKANKDDYYVPLLDPIIVHYLFLIAATSLLVSSMIKCYSAYNKLDHKESFYKSALSLILDLTIFFIEILGYELIDNRKISLSQDIIYDFDLSNVLNRIRDVMYLQSSFYSLMQSPDSELDSVEITTPLHDTPIR